MTIRQKKDTRSLLASLTRGPPQTTADKFQFPVSGHTRASSLRFESGSYAGAVPNWEDPEASRLGVGLAIGSRHGW